MFGNRPIMCKEVRPGDRLLLEDGREVLCTQSAEYDTIFEYEDGKRREWTDISLVAWNYTEAEFAALDSEVNG